MLIALYLVKQAFEVARAMEDAMDENRLPFDLVEDEIVLNNKDSITHRSQLVIVRYSPEIGMTYQTL